MALERAQGYAAGALLSWEEGTMATIITTQSVPCHLVRFPEELLLMVIEEFALADLKALQATSSKYVPITTPPLFEIAHLKVNRRSFDHLTSIARSPHLPKHAMTLEYGSCFYHALDYETLDDWEGDFANMWVDRFEDREEVSLWAKKVVPIRCPPKKY